MRTTLHAKHKAWSRMALRRELGRLHSSLLKKEDAFARKGRERKSSGVWLYFASCAPTSDGRKGVLI